MKKTWLALSVVLACFACSVSPAAAKIMRFTQQGDKALVFHMPDDWTANIDIETQAETLASPARHGFVSLSILANDSTLEATAAQVFKAAGATGSGSPRALTVSGQEAYADTAAGAGGGTLNLKLLVIRVDPHHVAVCLALVQVSAPPAEAQATDAILDTIRVSPPDTSFGS